VIRVFVPRDAAAVACGADAVAAAIVAAARKARGEIALVRNGSRGMLWLEPLVEVEHDGTRYGFGPLDAAGAAALVAALTGGTPASAIAHPQAVGLVEEVPFFARQTRLTFARCGLTDPVSLDDYSAHGSWLGLRRALELGPAGIVAEVTGSGLRGRGGAGSRPASSGRPSPRRRPRRNTSSATPTRATAAPLPTG
jgi:formate dehydrogenase iron-sulfur subunit